MFSESLTKLRVTSPDVFASPTQKAGGESEKKSVKTLAGTKSGVYLHPLAKRSTRTLSSAGSERLPYKQRVGGSNPSASTRVNAVFRFGKQGRLAQLVQSVCLTSRGSGVRIPQRPPENKQEKGQHDGESVRIALARLLYKGSSTSRTQRFLPYILSISILKTYLRDLNRL